MNNTQSQPEQFFYEGRDLEAMSFAPRYHHWILDHFEPYVGNHIVEVGAGIGTFSEILMERFQQPLTMMEPSGDMLAQLKSRLKDHELYDKSEIYHSFSKDYTFSTPPDTFFYVNVLEHIEHDEQELSWMYEQLQPGGHICIFVPALPWLYGSHDKKVDHFRRYTKKELVHKARNAGFSIQKSCYFDLPGIPLWWINFVLLKREMDPGAVHLYDHWIVPMLRKFEPSTMLPLGKNVLMVARKNE